MKAILGSGDYNDWVAMVGDFFALYAVVVLVNVIILVVVGLTFEFFNARHPELKIQKRRGNKRKWKELRHAPGSIAMIGLCFSGGLFAQANGWALAPLPLNWWTGPLFLFLSFVLYDAWFYWAHRLLHWKPLYKYHALHHKSLAPTVWSNHNDSLVDAFVHQAYYLVIPFVLPFPWQVLVIYKIYDQISGMLGHAGYEYFASPAGRKPYPLASTIFHDQHHSHFSYNYGHTFSLWDRLMGTMYPRYDETVANFEEESPFRK